MANYPGIIGAVRLPGRILLTTRRDGLAELRGSTLAANLMPDQLDVQPTSITAWDGGIAAYDQDRTVSVLLDGRWRQVLERLPPPGSARGQEGGESSRFTRGSILPLSDGRALLVASSGSRFEESPSPFATRSRAIASTAVA